MRTVGMVGTVVTIHLSGLGASFTEFVPGVERHCVLLAWCSLSRSNTLQDVELGIAD